jgi:hypothetical protein
LAIGDRSAALRRGYADLVAKEVAGADPYEDRGLSIGIIVFGVLTGSYFVAHHAQSSGLLSAAFGAPEALMLYGMLGYWILTAALIVVGRKQASRDLDLPGLFFAAFAIAWLLVVFPFDFPHLADLMPGFARFLVAWITNDAARVLLGLGFVVHLGLAVTSGALRISVYRARARRRD